LKITHLYIEQKSSNEAPVSRAKSIRTVFLRVFRGSPPDARQWRRGLSLLRGHAATERFTAGNKPQLRIALSSRFDRGADSRLGDRDGSRPFDARFHVRELITQAGDIAFDSRSATVSMNGCVMPAPAPWANTKYAAGFDGLKSSADTVRCASTSM
jgi:hypothetical protein